MLMQECSLRIRLTLNTTETTIQAITYTISNLLFSFIFFTCPLISGQAFLSVKKITHAAVVAKWVFQTLGISKANDRKAEHSHMQLTNALTKTAPDGRIQT